MKAIMVMYDTLCRNFLAPYGNDWVKTPNFTRLAEKSVTFDRNYVCSLPCMPARRDFHNSRVNFLQRDWGPLEPYDDSMPELLRQHGIYSALISDIAVIFAGLPDAYESEGSDRRTLAMPENQNLLIEAVCAVQPNTVVVLHGGAPMELPWLDKVAAVLLMYLGGECVGEAAVRLLMGEQNPSGKLAETWPVKLADNPSWLNFPGVDGVVEYREGVFVGYRYYDAKQMNVLFPFGYGLSYTNFSYTELLLDRASMSDAETLTVSCTVTNTGAYTGQETVQLYVCPPVGRVQRPVRELKGFEKVQLNPSESKAVTFHLKKRAFGPMFSCPNNDCPNFFF